MPRNGLPRRMQPLEADVAVLIGFTHAIIGAVFDGRQTLGKGAATRSVAIARGRQAESLVRPYVIVLVAPLIEDALALGEIPELAVGEHLGRDRAVEALVLALRLGMIRATMRHAHAQSQQPHRERG